MSKKKVYVSSTYVDLKDYRLAVKTALERAQYDVECMEKYPAFDERPKDKCLGDVDECDYYVLILAHRYGFVPPKDNPQRKSITHLGKGENVPGVFSASVSYDEASSQGRHSSFMEMRCRTCLTLLISRRVEEVSACRPLIQTETTHPCRSRRP